jgi:hypothetical protein
VNRNPDGSALSSSNHFSIQQQLATTYTTQPELKKGVVVCITHVPTGTQDYVTVRTSYNFKFLPLVGIAAGAVGGLKLSSTQTERVESPNVDTTGATTYQVGNQDGTQVGCS